MTTLHLRKSIGAVHLAQLLGVCRGNCFCSSRRFTGRGNERIRQKSMLLARPPYYRFAHWLLVACLLTGSAIATTARAQLRILATGQAGAGNIIVDGSRVYWINNNNSTVSSVDKLNGGVVFIHNPANNVPGGDIVQDNGNLYFASQTGPFFPSVWNLYSVPKSSSIVRQLTVDTVSTDTTTSGSGKALGISNGSLYYFGGLHSINCPGSPTYNPNYPNNCNDNRTIQKISTQGGTPAQVIPLASFPNLNIVPNFFDTDSVYLHWSDSNLNAILRVPLVGGLSYSSDANAPNGPDYLRSPTTGPTGGYHFWVEGDPNAVLREQTPGGVPFTLLNGLQNTGFNSFVQVGSFVYCVMRFQTNGKIIGIPINGGAPVDMVAAQDALGPRGLTSDGSYLYWTAVDGSIRRSTILPTTNAATNVAAYSATLNGSVNPGGLTTSVYFQYGPTTGYGFTTSVQTQTGNTFRNISASISALSPNHDYHFRIVAQNSAGTSYGGDRRFTTLTATGLPVVTTNPATLIASFSATLNGSLDPHGLTTNVYFQYGTTTSYGLTTAPQSQSGNTYRNISANISALLANHIYHFRIVASNSAGTTFGGDRTFTTLSATGPPVVTTSAATNVATSSATLNGSLDPHGLTTTVQFQWGTTSSYGHTTPMQSQTGNTYRNISANISGLTTHTTYHFRIVATNNAGIRLGGDRTFTTP